MTAEEREALLTPVELHCTRLSLPVQVLNIMIIATGQAISRKNKDNNQRVISLWHLNNKVLNFESSEKVIIVHNLPIFFLSEISEALYFSEVNITKFLNCFKELENRCEVTRKKLMKLLSKYSEQYLWDFIYKRDINIKIKIVWRKSYCENLQKATAINSYTSASSWKYSKIKPEQ